MIGSVQILGTGQLLELSRRMRAAGGPRLRQNTIRRIRRAAEPLHRDLQQAIRSQPITSQGRKAESRGGPSPTTRPLRATIAGAIRISVRTTSPPGARLWIDRGQLPPDMRNMPNVINSGSKGAPPGRIRHPVFGNRSKWVNQMATPPFWWDRTIAAGMPRMQAEVQRILADVRRDLQ
jgi:hypothetical protein